MDTDPSVDGRRQHAEPGKVDEGGRVGSLSVDPATNYTAGMDFVYDR